MNKEILRLAIPNILSNISIPLLSTVDTILMGQLSALHLGAIGVGGMIFNFIYWNFGFLRMGTTGMTAQAFGKEDKTEQIHLLLRASLIALIISLFMILLMKPIESLSIFSFNVEGIQADLVREYFGIRIWAAPASLMIYVLSGWFFGMQNAIFPLIITVIVNVANMILSIYLVNTMDLGMTGVAWGTVGAQYLGLLVAIFLFFFKYKNLFNFKEKAWATKQQFARFLSVNRDIFIRTIFLTLAFGFFYSKSAEAGEAILAINVVLLQFLNWMSYGVDGFAYASESLVGKYFGKKDNSKTYESIRLSFIWGFIFALLFSLAYLLFYNQIIAWFTKDPAILIAVVNYKWWMVLFPIVAFACYIWDGVFVGLTASRAMRDTMLVAFVIYILCYYLLVPFYPEKAIWISLMVLLFARGVLQSLIFYRKKLTLV